MKKLMKTSVLLLMVLLMVTLSGCGKSNDEILAGFNQLIPAETVTDKEEGLSVISGIEEYLDANLKHADEEYADYMFFVYLEEAYKIDSEYVNYRDAKDRYSKHLSDTMNNFLEIEIIDQEDPLTNSREGGVLEKDWSFVVSRALEMEKFISENSEDLNIKGYEYLKEHALWHYKYYVNLMLMGTSNNPIFSYQTGEFDENAMNMYTEAAQKNPDTVTAWALNEYFSYLDSINYKLNYNNTADSKIFFDTCSYIKNEAGQRVGK